MSSRSTKPLVIGMMPGPGNRYKDDRDLGPITGATGRRLASILGIPLEEYVARWDRINVFRERVEWNAAGATMNASAIYGAEQGFINRSLVVLLGKKVHEAFGFTDQELLQVIPSYSGNRVRYLLMPHPSGLCRWWNDPANTYAAEVALRSMYAYTQEKRHASACHA